MSYINTNTLVEVSTTSGMVLINPSEILSVECTKTPKDSKFKLYSSNYEYVIASSTKYFRCKSTDLDDINYSVLDTTANEVMSKNEYASINYAGKNYASINGTEYEVHTKVIGETEYEHFITLHFKSNKGNKGTYTCKVPDYTTFCSINHKNEDVTEKYSTVVQDEINIREKFNKVFKTKERNI